MKLTINGTINPLKYWSSLSSLKPSKIGLKDAPYVLYLNSTFKGLKYKSVTLMIIAKPVSLW